MTRVLILIFIASSCLFAQRVISVDESVSRNQDKSVVTAIAFSLLIPGSGEYYLGETSFYKPFLWTDLAFWFTTVATYQMAEKQLSTAHAKATKNAGLSIKRKDIDFLNLIGDYRSRGGVAGQNSNPDMNEDYNQAMLRSGKAIDEEYPNTAEYSWDWGSSDNPQTTENIKSYKKSLKNYRLFKIAFQASVGVLIFDRVLSSLNVLRIYKATSSKSMASQWKLVPLWSPDSYGTCLFYEF